MMTRRQRLEKRTYSTISARFLFSVFWFAFFVVFPHSFFFFIRSKINLVFFSFSPTYHVREKRTVYQISYIASRVYKAPSFSFCFPNFVLYTGCLLCETITKARNDKYVAILINFPAIKSFHRFEYRNFHSGSLFKLCFLLSAKVFTNVTPCTTHEYLKIR